MQTYFFSLTASYRPETVERITRVIRHRGFLMVKLGAEVKQGVIVMSLGVQSMRNIQMLYNSLLKLPDVQQVSGQQER